MKIKSENMKSIIAINREAARRGMSYGQYSAEIDRQHKAAAIEKAKKKTRKAVHND